MLCGGWGSRKDPTRWVRWGVVCIWTHACQQYEGRVSSYCLTAFVPCTELHTWLSQTADVIQSDDPNTWLTTMVWPYLPMNGHVQRRLWRLLLHSTVHYVLCESFPTSSLNPRLEERVEVLSTPEGITLNTMNTKWIQIGKTNVPLYNVFWKTN
jgi:hypothetical protein